MTSIPLHCNICPKEPEFSDISHLLTHVASKGHLAQQFKAQVRARQDASIRAKLDAYDRWYGRHQIEKLLSERMIAKDSKDSSCKVHKNKGVPDPAASTKAINSRRRRPKGLAQPEDQASPVKIEGVLDPQLCHSLPASRSRSRQSSTLTEQSSSEDYYSPRQISEHFAAPPNQCRPSPFLGQLYHDYHHRPYVPRMSEWQGARSPHRAMIETTSTKSTNNQPPPLGYDTDGESDYFQTFLRSPTRTAYPDPSEVTGQPSDLLHDTATSMIKQDSIIEQSTRELNTKSSSVKETASTLQSPVLKGVKWPGMSLFDSASLDAQRLRNQKKGDSVLEQMEHNSAMVEQMERIYWPDGSLKKQRLITGNVDSSPIKELTPPPKVSKRKRAKANSILTDLSTNAPILGKKIRQRKIAPPDSSTHAPNLRTISTKALAELEPPQYIYPRSAHMGYNPPNDDECERELTHRLPKVGRKKAFHIFNDHDKGDDASQLPKPTKTNDLAFSQSLHGHQGSTQSNSSGSALGRVQASGPRFEDPPHGLPWDSQVRSAKRLSRALVDENSENITPVLDGGGRIDDEAAPVQNERVTQRYFSATANQPPQFFSSMPPGMDFGGLMDPRYHGSTLNPLNPYLRLQRVVHSHTRAALSSQAAGLPTELVGSQEPSDQPDPRRQGSRAASKRT